MAKPYKEGSGWAYRLRAAGQDVYRSGFSSEAKARHDMEKIRIELTEGPAQSGHGPQRTSLGVAFSDYARQRLPYLKGAQQDTRRINRYLRALKLPVISLTPVEVVKDGKCTYWQVEFVHETTRAIPSSLARHRGEQEGASEASDRARKRLAMTMMSEVTTHQIQGLVDALSAEGKLAATIHLERSELRRLFKHAIAVWNWRIVGGNPAGANLKMPEVDNERKRIVSNEEWARLSEVLARYPNPHVAPLTCLMLETSMRSCEPLVTLRWRHIYWDQRYIALPDAKAGGRQVPLTPGALHILKQLSDHAATPPHPDDRVFPTSYEAVKKAWTVARKAVGIPDVNLHDLRHTSATRFALEFKGNLPVLMVITGHKTAQMAMRYVNVKATEVATMMHGESLDIQNAAAGYQMSVTEALDASYSQCRSGKPVATAKQPSHSRSDIDNISPQSEGPAAEKPPAQEKNQSPRQAQTVSSGNVIAVNFQRKAA